MNSIINSFLSVTHISIIFIIILSLLKFDILNKLFLANKLIKYRQLLSSANILMSIIFIYLIFYVYIHNYARLNLLISLVLLCIGIGISFLLKKLNNNTLTRYKYLFFTTLLFTLVSNIYSHSDAFSITNSGSFNILHLLIIGIFSILSGLVISIDLSFNFLKKIKVNRTFINRYKYNTILLTIIINLLLLLFITEAPFACDIILFISIILGLSISKFMYNIEIHKIKNILDFSLSILLCLASIFIENIILIMISSIISALILKESNINEFNEIFQKFKSAFTGKKYLN